MSLFDPLSYIELFQKLDCIISSNTGLSLREGIRIQV